MKSKIEQVLEECMYKGFFFFTFLIFLFGYYHNDETIFLNGLDFQFPILVAKKIWNNFHWFSRFIGSVVPVEAFMQIMLDQEHKYKIINTKVHEVLTWFSQAYLHPQMKENHSTI